MQRRRITISALFAIINVAGCADLKGPRFNNDTTVTIWSGRLSIRTLPRSETGLESRNTFHSEFELQGHEQQGELRLFTPLGSTAAVIRWTPQGAELLARGQTQLFGNLRQLIHKTLGVDLPVAALVSWLDGQPCNIAGWQVDLTEFSAGKIAAQRNTPEPIVELRLVLNPSH